MKKIKKSLVSVLLASSCLFSAVSMNSSAVEYPFAQRIGLDAFENIKEEYGLVALDDELGKRSQFQCNPYNIDRLQHRLYYFPGYEGKIVEERRLFSSFKLSFKINQAYEDTAAIEELINEIFDSSYSIGNHSYKNNSDLNYIRFEIRKSSIESEAIKLAKELKEKLEQQYEFECFGYRDNNGDCIIWQFADGSYLNYCESMNDEKAEILRNYLEENNIDAYVETGESRYGNPFYSVITNNMTQEERFSLAVDIYEDTGISSMATYIEEGDTYASIEIDMLNSVEGDANNDGQLTIADATAIVQALGNADEYALSAQGKYNADFDCDGITGMDAVRIQKICTQMGEIQ